MARGGAERVAATLANAWADHGSDVWLISTYLGGRATGYPLRPGVSTVYFDHLIRSGKSSRWFDALRKVMALRRIARTIGPDVVVSFLTNVNVLAITAFGSGRLPLIVSERTDPAADIELSRALRVARAVAYPFADALVVQTAAAAQRYGARLRRIARIEVIHNPLPQELDVSSLRARHEDNGGLVIAMGRLSPEKGFDSLIEAYGRALGEDTSWALQIWGEGPLQSELTQLIARLHLTGRVELCGATTQPWATLAAAQIFVLSSKYEGFPNAMLEAMAVGLPCIAFDCPSGPRELADGGSAAIIVRAGAVSELAVALRQLAADREARRALGERAAAHVRREFGQQRVVRDWDRLIEELLPGGTSPDSIGGAN
jgi:glycosyltransferase involved in cell wall biosynthesis